MANRIYQLSVEGLLNTSYRACVLHFQSTGTNDNDTLAGSESLINGFDASAKANFLATQPNTYQLVRLVARRLVLLPSASGCKNYGVGTQGGQRPNGATTQQTSPSVFLVPTMGTKSGGRIFLPGLAQADAVDSAFTATYIGLVDTFINGLVAGFTNAGITWTLGVFSRKLGSISNVVAHNLSPVVGFQGKRRRPVGAV